MIDFEKKITEDNIAIVNVEGRMEDFSCRYFFGCMEDLLEDGHREIVIDCENLGMISSAYIGCLIKAQRRARRHGGVIVLANVNNSIHEVVGFLGLNRLLGICPTLESALIKTRRKFRHQKTNVRRQLSTSC